MREGPEKSEGAFRTIAEAAAELEVPQHVLRFWETRFAQIRPIKRAGGRRYYRPDDIDLLKGVKHLLHGRGYTIKGAQGILRERGQRFVQSIGRGEAQAMAPDPQTTASDPQATPLEPQTTAPGPQDAAHRAEDDSSPDRDISAEDRSILEAVLHDLRACRDAVARLGAPASDALD